jgi:hypothetical protein
MNDIWDKFETNIGEMLGEIERKSFVFNYKRYEVWYGGNCIYSGNSNKQIIAKINDKQLNVEIDDISINNYINKHFSFREISSVNDRIMWSKDIFNTSDLVERNNPDISSLFYKKGVLSKVTFTIHDPNTLVEFYL